MINDILYFKILLNHSSFGLNNLVLDDKSQIIFIVLQKCKSRYSKCLYDYLKLKKNNTMQFN